MNLATPQPNIATLAVLPIASRQSLDNWRAELASVTEPVTQNLRLVAKRLGVSYRTARRKYDEFRRQRVEALIDGRTLPRPRAELDPDFVGWWRALAESNQRKTRPAYREFIRSWHRGDLIPGLDPDQPRHIVPRGCSYGNLARLANDGFALKVMRVGTAAAAKHAPKIFSTRAELWPASHYMFDDLWHDNFVVFRGQVVRVLEFDALDVFSACKISWGTKPRIRREDGTMDGLKESFMRMLLASVLWHEGFSPRGTELLAEHGTAAIREDVERLLHDRTGGLITVRRSGIQGKEQSVAGMFQGRGGGNPRFKASLESLRNLIHNELAMLPGQTGKDVEHRPEQLHGTLDHTTDLLKAFAVLARERPDRAALLKLPLLEYHSQFLPVLVDIYDRINRRDWHTLEGWSACGHICLEYRLAPDTAQWLSHQDYLALPDPTRNMLLDTARQDPHYLRQRQLSPREVWQRGRADLQRIPAFVVSDILGPDLARERACRDSYFTFTDAELSPEPLIYESRIETIDGHQVELKPDTYLTWVNPFDLSQMFVGDARGRTLGVSLRVQRCSPANQESLHHAFGRRNHRLAEQLQPIRERHAQITREATARDAHNARVLAGEPITPEEIARSRQLRHDIRNLGPAAAAAILSPSEPSHKSDQSDPSDNISTTPEDFLNSIL